MNWDWFYVGVFGATVFWVAVSTVIRWFNKPSRKDGGQ